MAKFNVILTETVTYETVVEADDALSAAEDATECWVNCTRAEQEKYFAVQGHGVESDSNPVT